MCCLVQRMVYPQVRTFHHFGHELNNTYLGRLSCEEIILFAVKAFLIEERIICRSLFNTALPNLNVYQNYTTFELELMKTCSWLMYQVHHFKNRKKMFFSFMLKIIIETVIKKIEKQISSIPRSHGLSFCRTRTSSEFF